MSTALDVLLHKRRLQAVLKQLELDEILIIQSKLNEIVEERKQAENELAEQRKRKEARIEALRKQMEEEGISPHEIIGSGPGEKKPRKKLPPKYEYMDAHGAIKTWSGQGRTPKPIEVEVAKGVELSSFLIKK